VVRRATGLSGRAPTCSQRTGVVSTPTRAWSLAGRAPLRDRKGSGSGPTRARDRSSPSAVASSGNFSSTVSPRVGSRGSEAQRPQIPRNRSGYSRVRSATAGRKCGPAKPLDAARQMQPQSCLAGSRRADDSHAFSRLDIQGYVFQNRRLRAGSLKTQLFGADQACTLSIRVIAGPECVPTPATPDQPPPH